MNDGRHVFAGDMDLEFHDTICAIATPAGEGGIGIVRISGEKALEIASCLVRLRSGRSLAAVESHRLYYADLLDAGERQRTSGEGVRGGGSVSRSLGIVDEALVVVMRGPHSFTGETVVEIQCHGAPLVLQVLCEGMVGLGARVAEPGEFTKRAFLNGRLDLTQAEAVLDTIRSKTAGGLRIAQEQLRGLLSSEIERLREGLIALLAHVEAGIDFTEEDLSFIETAALQTGIDNSIEGVTRLLESGREGRILRDGVTAAIIGSPNVGKSSLLNALTRTDRAIVTAIPGTTRDVMEEVLNIRGVPIRLLDTAGVQETVDPVEQEGIRRALLAMEQAELVLLMVDGSGPLASPDRDLLELHRDKRRVIVVNKCDLPVRLDFSELDALASQDPDCRVVGISARTAEGLDQLRDHIRALVLRPDFEPAETPVVTKMRHLSALNRAKESLLKSRQTLAQGHSGEFVAMDLRAAIDSLGEITGRVSTDEILEQIFKDFCIGK